LFRYLIVQRSVCSADPPGRIVPSGASVSNSSIQPAGVDFPIHPAVRIRRPLRHGKRLCKRLLRQYVSRLARRAEKPKFEIGPSGRCLTDTAPSANASRGCPSPVVFQSDRIRSGFAVISSVCAENGAVSTPPSRIALTAHAAPQRFAPHVRNSVFDVHAARIIRFRNLHFA
jgi:hypothetical protein